MGSIQPQWRIIDQTLDHIQAELGKHPAFTGTGGPNPGSVKYYDNWEKLERYGRILQNALRSVRNSEHLLQVQTLAAKRIPREHRYSVNQSLRARQSNLAYVHQKAQTVLELLQKMVGNYGRPDFGSLDKLFDQAEDGLLAIVSDPGQSPQEPGWHEQNPGATAMPIHTLLAFIAFYLVHLRNRKRPERDGPET
jgi:hypothetical protein